MLFKLNLQLFASKKGVGSTKNGRDSAGRRLGDNGAMQVALSTVKEEQEFTQVLTLKKVKTIPSSPHVMVL